MHELSENWHLIRNILIVYDVKEKNNTTNHYKLSGLIPKKNYYKLTMTRTTLTYLINFSKKMKRNSIAPVKFEMEILFKLGLTN